MTRRPRAAFIAAAITLGLLPACSIEVRDPDATSTPSASSVARPEPSSTPRSRLSPELAEALTAVIEAHPEADVAVALTAVGTAEDRQVHLVPSGSAPPTLVAWSTMKVPLALAASRADRDGTRTDVAAALTASDNEAALRLWTGLGDGDEASAAVEDVLAEGGDPRSRVPATSPVVGYSPFGQTPWRLDDQARVVGALPCLLGSSAVTEPMGEVQPGQAWGLGQVEDAQIKGGWGPTPDGYVVRQVALIPGSSGGLAAVTLQVRSDTYDAGVAIADELAAAVEDEIDALPTGRCTG